MSILITGGAGYIGSHTCAELLNSGEDIVALDNFSNSSPDVIRRVKEISGRDFPLYAVDMLHEQGLRRVFEREDIEAVIHFAGYKAVGESVRMPLEYYNNNVAGSLTLFGVMRDYGCKKLVFSSSATVYGHSKEAPFREDTPLSAINPYGATKLMIEDILRDLYTSAPEWRISLLRYFNPIGAHPSGELGEEPSGIPNNLFPYISRVAQGKLERLYVFGDDYETPDGTCVRDYIHVCDLAEGHLAALRHIRGNTGAEAVNLGTGNGYSVFEALRAFENASGLTIPYEVTVRRQGDSAVMYADTTKAKALLGWSASRGLDEMCRDQWKYAGRNGDRL
ncbi:MAG: UDP-glucose 4-epimerase GalE [Oscillospiraceae bacterium]|nr:UDP-glucose 4-epimerase GalE [Oscillospiraceae bacterium]